MPNPLSLRVKEETLTRLTSRADRFELAPRTLAQRYIEEGLRRDEHPAVHFVDGPAGRRAALLGTGLDVWEAILVVRDNDGNAAEAAEYLDMPLPAIEAAIRYYGAHRDEIDRLIELNEREAEEAQAAAAAGRAAFDRRG
jgi:uncharacterized protein (DUF433 family)